MKIWSNNIWIEAKELISSEGFQYGYALFETILVQDNIAINIDCHISRIENSIKKLSSKTFSCDKLLIQESINKLPKGIWVLKIIVYKVGNEFKMKLFYRAYPYNHKILTDGFSLTKSNIIKSKYSLLLQHKTTNYLENYLERQRAVSLGYNDVYFLNNENIITECSSSNLFIKKGNELITSPILEGLLPGIMRNKILKIKKVFNIIEENITENMLKNADNVFVSNSLIGFVGINKIDNIEYDKNYVLINNINEIIDFKI